MIRTRLHLSALAMLAAEWAHVEQQSRAQQPEVRLYLDPCPEPARELTAQDVERIEAAKAKRQRRAARAGR